MTKINIDKMALEVMKNLETYRDATLDIVEYAVDKTTNDVLDDIRENIEAAGIGGGNYKKAWRAKKFRIGHGVWSAGKIIYAKAPYNSIAHLLENGHAKVGGGRVPGRPHIAPAAERALRYMETYIKSGILKSKLGGDRR